MGFPSFSTGDGFGHQTETIAITTQTPLKIHEKGGKGHPVC